MKRLKLFVLTCMLIVCNQFLYAQQSEDKRMKIEITVGKTTAVLTSVAINAAKPYSDVADSTQKEEAKNFNLAFYFDSPNMPLVAAFVKNKKCVEGVITMVDSYGKRTTRKIEFKGAVLDAFSDQLTNDYSNSYMTIRCSELTVDGLKLEL
jgi:hypothetical protein